VNNTAKNHYAGFGRGTVNIFRKKLGRIRTTTAGTVWLYLNLTGAIIIRIEYYLMWDWKMIFSYLGPSIWNQQIYLFPYRKWIKVSQHIISKSRLDDIDKPILSYIRKNVRMSSGEIQRNLRDMGHEITEMP
jgi:hypothetical protein